MNNEYSVLKDNLLRVKKKIDGEVKSGNISSNLLRFDDELENTYKKLEKYFNKNNLKNSDREFVSFNYFAAKTYILLAKGYKFKATVSFLQALQHFIKYLDHIQNPQKWKTDYYRLLSSHIINANLELFGNTSQSTLQEILAEFQKTIAIPLKHSTHKTEIYRLLSNFLYSLVSRSSEIYTEQHIETAKQIEELALNFKSKSNDNLCCGDLEALRFILTKRKLHYYLRQLVPKDAADTRKDTSEINRKIEEIIEEMKTISKNELSFYKEIMDDEKIEFKKFLAEIDKLAGEYYQSLWINRDLIDTFKKLENIFSTIRNNWQKINTPLYFPTMLRNLCF